MSTSIRRYWLLSVLFVGLGLLAAPTGVKAGRSVADAHPATARQVLEMYAEDTWAPSSP